MPGFSVDSSVSEGTTPILINRVVMNPGLTLDNIQGDFAPGNPQRPTFQLQLTECLHRCPLIGGWHQRHEKLVARNEARPWLEPCSYWTDEMRSHLRNPGMI